MDCKEAADEISRLQADVERLTSWVADLQSGMYVNCVYCGHRYGPGEITPVSMADALKAHIETCPQHPMSALRAENLALHEQVAAIESREVCTVAGG
jgi:DNA-directed RNA polymerase subunit RPC12/RpoP